MNKENKIKFVIAFSTFINSHVPLFESMYKLLKNGKSELDLEDGKIDLKATNFDNIKNQMIYFFLLCC